MEIGEEKRKRLMVVISSPSGAGKTTLTRMLLNKHPEFGFSVSHTTRAKRKDEVDGKDYYFVTRERFEQMVKEGKFIEWALVHGNLYGTSIQEVERLIKEGKDIVFDVDYRGAQAIKRKYPETITIFVLPPSLGELKRRLKLRRTESLNQLSLRFKNAIEELRHYHLFDYIVINDDLERAFSVIESIVTAERNRSFRNYQFAEELLKEKDSLKEINLD